MKRENTLCPQHYSFYKKHLREDVFEIALNRHWQKKEVGIEITWLHHSNLLAG